MIIFSLYFKGISAYMWSNAPGLRDTARLSGCRAPTAACRRISSHCLTSLRSTHKGHFRFLWGLRAAARLTSTCWYQKNDFLLPPTWLEQTLPLSQTCTRTGRCPLTSQRKPSKCGCRSTQGSGWSKFRNSNVTPFFELANFRANLKTQRHIPVTRTIIRILKHNFHICDVVDPQLNLLYLYLRVHLHLLSFLLKVERLGVYSVPVLLEQWMTWDLGKVHFIDFWNFSQGQIFHSFAEVLWRNE